MDVLLKPLPPLPVGALDAPIRRQHRQQVDQQRQLLDSARRRSSVATMRPPAMQAAPSLHAAHAAAPSLAPPVEPENGEVFAEMMAQRRKSVAAAALADATASGSARGARRRGTGRTSLTAALTEERAVVVETREFAQKQLAAFRAHEEERQNASRRIRNGLRNIEALIADVPVARELALDVKERAPTEEVLHLKLANTALHAKVLEITELLEVCIKSENNMRRRMESAEQRAAAAEDRVIDLQAQLFEANLRSAAAASPHNRAAARRF